MIHNINKCIDHVVFVVFVEVFYDAIVMQCSVSRIFQFNKLLNQERNADLETKLTAARQEGSSSELPVTLETEQLQTLEETHQTLNSCSLRI